MPWKGKNQVEKRSGKRNAKIVIFVFPPTILRLSSLSFAFSPLWRFVTYEKSSSTWLIWFFKKAKIHVVTFLYQSIGTRLTTLNRCGKESGKKNVGANYFTLINNVRIIEMKITISFSYFFFSSPFLFSVSRSRFAPFLLLPPRLSRRKTFISLIWIRMNRARIKGNIYRPDRS